MKRTLLSIAILCAFAAFALAADYSWHQPGIATLGTDDRPWKELRLGGAASSIIFDGATLDAYETTLSIADPSADATATLQAHTGYISGDAVETLTGTTALTTASCGKTLILSHATEFATTLPAVASSANCRFKFIIGNAPESADYTVVTNSSENKMLGGINELEVDTGDDGPSLVTTAAAGDTITFVDGTAVLGDYVEVISDGSYWYISGQAKADGGITFTQAS